MTTAAILAALPATPLPHAIEKLFSDIARDMFPPRAMTGAADGPPRTAAPLLPTPDFSPDFSSHVKQAPIIRRNEAAEICGVSLDWFDRNIVRLICDEGFPAPHEKTGQRRWRRENVAAWADVNSHHPALARARAAHAKAKAGRP